MSDNESARDHYDNAIVASLAGDQLEVAIKEFEEALAAGLPGEKEPYARILLAAEYVRAAARSGLSIEQMIRSANWAKAESQYTVGLRLDREGGHGNFLDRNGRYLLYRFDQLCHTAGKERAKESLQAGIKYFETMLSYCDYLPSSPLIMSLFKLGDMYHDAGEDEKAISCWQRLIEAAPVDYMDESGNEAKTRQYAQGNIASVQRARPGSATESSGKGCLIFIAILALPPLLMLALLMG